MDKRDQKASAGPRKFFRGECGGELNEEADFCVKCGTKAKHRQSLSKPSSAEKKEEKKNPKRRSRGIFPLAIMIAVVGYALLTFILTDRLPITAISFSTDNSRLMSVGEDGYLKSWDVNLGRSINRKEIPSEWGSTNVLTWDSDNRLIALARTYPGRKDNKIQFFNSNNLSKVSSISAGSEVIAALCIDPDGKTLYSVTNRLGIGVWDIQKGEKLGGLKDLSHRLVSHATFDKQCQRIATIEGTTTKNNSFDSRDKKLVVYQRINMETLWDEPFSDELSVHPDLVGLSLDGETAITIKRNDQKLKTINIDTGETRESILPNHIYPSSLAMGVRGGMALGGRKGLINIYSGNGILLQTLNHGSSIGITLKNLFD